MAAEKIRLHLLDALRGFLLLHMIAFHGMWNLVFRFGVPVPWYNDTPGYIWQQFICWSFILLSGFCWSMSRNHLKRGLLVFGGGAVVSIATLLFMPENCILFGILTCIGSCMLLMIPLDKLFRKVPAAAGGISSFSLFLLLRNCASGSLGFEKFVLCALPPWLYRNSLTTFFGFPHAGFFSTDYFSLLPWFFLFLTGYFLFRIGKDRGWNEKLFAKGQFPLLNFLGKHSLLVYLLHQPVLYGLCMLYFYCIR